MRSFLLLVTVLLASALWTQSAFTDMPYYVMPVRVMLADSTLELGYLTLYGDEIRGYMPGTHVRHIVTFGRSGDSTATLQLDGVDYDFSSITVSGDNVTVSFGEEHHSVHNVDFFFTDQGVRFCTHAWTTKRGFLETESKFIPLRDIIQIRRLGGVLSIAAYPD